LAPPLASSWAASCSLYGQRHRDSIENVVLWEQGRWACRGCDGCVVLLRSRG